MKKSVSWDNFINNVLIPEAMRSNMRTRLGAALLLDGKKSYHLGHNEDRCSYKGQIGCSMHAEANVIINYLGKYLSKSNNKWINSKPKLVKKIDLMVVRIDSLGVLKNARPCQNCLNLMNDVGIKRVSYSSGNGNEIITEKVDRMISIYVTIGSKITDLYQNYNMNKEILRKGLKEYYPEYYYIKYLDENMPNKVNYQNFSYFINHDLNNKIPSYKIKNKFCKKSNHFEINIYDNKNKLVLNKIIGII